MLLILRSTDAEGRQLPSPKIAKPCTVTDLVDSKPFKLGGACAISSKDLEQGRGHLEFLPVAIAGCSISPPSRRVRRKAEPKLSSFLLSRQ